MPRPKETTKRITIEVTEGEPPLIKPVEFAYLVGCGASPQRVYNRMKSKRWASAVVDVAGERVDRKLDLRASLALWYSERHP